MPAAEWAIHANPAHAANVRREVVAFARKHGMTEQALKDLALVVSEAITNALEHGYRDGPAGDVTVTLEVGDQAFMLRVRDRGVGLSPPRESPSLGHGLRLISTLARDVHLSESDDGGIEVSVSFPRAPPSRAPDA
jgi:anti-sigma regulatory factor (Ser/Thr protein kinase)